jgi:hypothetical protein
MRRIIVDQLPWKLQPNAMYLVGTGTKSITYTDKYGRAISVAGGSGEGAQGPEGPQGPQGATGPKGDTGDTGPAGAAGANREDGAAGATGATGPAGPADGRLVMTPGAGLFIANNLTALALGTIVGVANRTLIAPFTPAHAVTIDQLGVSVSTFVASSNCKCVIFSSDSQGRPTTLLRETANIDSGSNGTKLATITSLTLSAGGKYWVGVRTSSTQTVRAVAAGGAGLLTVTSAATPVLQSTLTRTETFASAATDWTYATSQHSNLLVPLILMRVA